MTAKKILIAIGVSLFVTGGMALAHGTQARVEVESNVTGAISSGTSVYSFEMIDTKVNKMVKDSDLTIAHEKILHFVVYDSALQEFQHVHPEYKNNHWEVTVNIPRSGHYWMWAQGTLASDGTEFISPVEQDVTGGLAANPLPPVMTESRSGENTGTVVTLSNDKIHSGSMVMLMVDFSHVDGTTAKLTNYMGALAHVSAVSSDADSMVHVHPMATSNPNSLMLHTQFADAGNYRLWIEFVDGGVYKVIPLTVEVLP